MESIEQWAFDLSMGYYPHQMFFLGDAPSFENPFISPVMDIPDVKHSQREKRYWALGWTTTGLYVKIWYTFRGDVIRIIDWRKFKLLNRY